MGATRTVPPGSHRPWPEIGPEDVRAVTALLEKGRLSGARDPAVVGLEKEWSRRCEVPHCVATGSGTAALHCAVVAAGVEPGAEVVLPALTFAASAFAVCHQGAVPVFADVDRHTFTLDPQSVEECITPRTRAVMAVHLHGLPAEMDGLAAVAGRYGLKVIEDAAQAHGAEHRGRKVGSIGDAAAFSLNATKLLVGGEGGLFVTGDEAMARAARRLCLFGEDPERRIGLAGAEYRSHGLGWNYRCAPLAAALARSQLRRLDEVVVRARASAEILTEGLRAIRGVTPPEVPADRTCVWHKYRVRLEPSALGWNEAPELLRDRVITALQREGVAAALWQTEPLPAHPAFRRGGIRPWLSGEGDGPLHPWDPAPFPGTCDVLASTFLLGSERFPICAQDPELMHRYVEAVAKVLAGLEDDIPASARQTVSKA
jgi:perosamine synthetase